MYHINSCNECQFFTSKTKSTLNVSEYIEAFSKFDKNTFLWLKIKDHSLHEFITSSLIFFFLVNGALRRQIFSVNYYFYLSIFDRSGHVPQAGKLLLFTQWMMLVLRWLLPSLTITH